MRNKLINFRKDMGLSSEAMAKKIGISTSFYDKIEYGDRNLSFNFITLFKTAFPKAEVDEIFFKNDIHEKCD